MTTVGPRYPGTMADDSGVGTLTWSNPGNVVSDNSTYASCSPSSSGTYTTHYIKCTNFGFSIPSNGTINGITVEVDRYCDQNGLRYTLDSRVSLVRAGTVEATNKGDTSNKWPTSQTVKTYGGAADLWSASWSYSDINNSGFGVAFAAAITRAAQSATAYVDFIRITVDYTAGGTNYSQTVSGALSPAGALTITTKKTLSGAVSSSGGLARSINRLVSGILSFVGEAERDNIRKLLSGSVSFSGSVSPVKTIIVALSAVLSFAGALTRGTTLRISGSLTSNGVTQRVNMRLTQVVSGVLSSSGAVIRTTRRTLAGALTPSGAVVATKSFIKVLAGALTPSGALSRSTRRTISGTLTSAGWLVRGTRRAVAGTLGPSGSIIRKSSKVLSGTLASSGAVRRATSHTLTGTLTSSGAITKGIRKVLAGVLDFVGDVVARMRDNGSMTPQPPQPPSYGYASAALPRAAAVGGFAVTRLAQAPVVCGLRAYDLPRAVVVSGAMSNVVLQPAATPIIVIKQYVNPPTTGGVAQSNFPQPPAVLGRRATL